MKFITDNITPELITGNSILEVGSYNVNGGIKEIVTALKPLFYMGVDMREGPDVDAVVNACELTYKFGHNMFDVVISCEMLEHVEDWRSAIVHMKNVLKPGGTLFLTTRSYGFPLHDYPDDYWRFEQWDMNKIFADMDTSIYNDTEYPGVFVKAMKHNVNLNEIEVYSMKGLRLV